MKRRIIGIDPGCNGAIACIYENGIAETWKLGQEDEILSILSELSEIKTEDGVMVTAYLEKITGYIPPPKGDESGKLRQPGSRMFTFGQGYGFLRGALRALQIPFYDVTPATWQKIAPYTKKLKGVEKKRALKSEAAKRFPNIKVTLKNADALLIAEYGYLRNGH